MEPILEDLRQEYKGKFEVIFINVNKDRQAAQKHNIRMIPTQVFFNSDGIELSRHVGFYPKDAILQKWIDLGYDFNGGQNEN